MKTFENIKTTVDLVDRSDIDSIELNVIFPPDNTTIINYIRETDSTYKLKLNSDNLGIYKTDIPLNENSKNTIQQFIAFLIDLDTRYVNRTKIVSDFLNLVNN
jgi:hypothetical protein